jgi:hypothetical protein
MISKNRPAWESTSLRIYYNTAVTSIQENRGFSGVLPTSVRQIVKHRATVGSTSSATTEWGPCISVLGEISTVPRHQVHRRCESDRWALELLPDKNSKQSCPTSTSQSLVLAEACSQMESHNCSRVCDSSFGSPESLRDIFVVPSYAGWNSSLKQHSQSVCSWASLLVLAPVLVPAALYCFFCLLAF